MPRHPERAAEAERLVESGERRRCRPARRRVTPKSDEHYSLASKTTLMVSVIFILGGSMMTAAILFDVWPANVQTTPQPIATTEAQRVEFSRVVPMPPPAASVPHSLPTASLPQATNDASALAATLPPPVAAAQSPLAPLSHASPTPPPPWSFVSATPAGLTLNGVSYRFVGINMVCSCLRAAAVRALAVCHCSMR